MKRLVVFGDSYVAASRGYARMVAPLLGMRGAAMGLGGTGFVKDSGKRQPYPSRLGALLSTDADVVVVQASGNDAVCDLDTVEKTARDFLAPVVERFGRVYLLGPLWALDGSEHLSELRDRMQAVASDHGAVFIDALGWLAPAHMGEDGAHPTWRGHAVIAWRLAQAVRHSSTPPGR